MGIAAIPDYLKQNFVDAPPGHRFSLYFPLWQPGGWTREPDKAAGKDNSTPATGKGPVLKSITALPEHSKRAMQELAARTSALAKSCADMCSIETRSIAPFATGLGIEHPLENGFAFLNPYGLPYLPGSSVKGVLRKAAQELASGDWGGQSGWDAASISALFGIEDDNGETHQRGALSFWDVVPQLPEDSTDKKQCRMQVEIMTPHQGEYYRGNESPHDSGSPNPIVFLAVPPGSGFSFHVQCNRPFLARIAPQLAEGDRWKTLMQAGFIHAFEWLGFGAKTAVGYGAFELPDEEKKKRQAALKAADQLRADQLKKQQELEKAEAEAIRLKIEAEKQSSRLQKWEGVEVTYNKGSGAFTAMSQDKKQQAIAQGDAAKTLVAAIGPDLLERFKKKGVLKLSIEVDVDGKRVIIHSIKSPAI